MRILRHALMAVTATAALMSAGQAFSEEVVVRGLRRTRPVDTPPPLELYAGVPHIEQVALSPDGERVAFTTRQDDVRILAYYRFSDRTRGYYKLTGGEATAMNWADKDHVLISDSRLAVRGTCEAGGASRTQQSLNSRDVPLPADVQPGSAEAAAAQNQMQLLFDSIQVPRCAYFGVRGENVITSVNVLTGKGASIGNLIGDAPSLALGIPSRISPDGTPQLEGPFLEMRAKSVGNQPAQRVYLWKVDPETGHGKLIDDGGGDIDRESRYVDDWLFDYQGTLVARTVYDFGSRIYRIEMRVNGKWKPALSREIAFANNTFAPFLIGLAADGKSVVILDTNTHGRDAKGAERRFHYYRLEASGTLSEKLEAGDASQDRPVFDPRSGRLAGFARDAEEPQYTIADSDLAAVYDKAEQAAPGQRVEVISIADDLQKALIRTTGGEDTGSYFLLDFTNHNSVNIGEDFPQVPTNWIAVQEPLVYKAADGLEINAIVTLPPKPAARKLPLVVLPHDGPQDHDRFGFDWLAQALATRGYLVLQPNYRGSDGHDAAFVAAGYGQWAGKSLSDIKDGIDELVHQGLADPNRVCMIGVGYGGYAALNAAENGSVRCAGAIGGISDVDRYVAWRNSMAPSPDPDAYAGLSPHPQWPRTFRADPASLRSLNLFVGSGAPSISADAVKVPVLLIHQSGDGIVPAAQSRKLRDALVAAGKRVDYVELKGSGHAPDTQATRLATLQAVTAFLATHNPASN